MDPKTALERVEKALEALRAGRMIIVVDDEDRENEGDLVMAAEKAISAFRRRWRRRRPSTS